MTFEAGSMSCWFRTDTGFNWGGGVLGTIWAGNQGASGNMQLQMSYAPDATNGQLLLNILTSDGIWPSTIADVSSASTYADNLWHHVAATWYRDTTTGDGGIAMYVDGGATAGGETLVDTFAGWAPGETRTFSLRDRIGKGSNNASEFQGYIDEPAIWANTLSATDIKAQYDAAFTANANHPGDANNDGMVNLADLQILGDNWQSTTATWAEADFTGDGNVNLADLQIIGDNWGYGTSPDVAFDEALAGVVIPEPATLGLLGLGAVALLRRRAEG